MLKLNKINLLLLCGACVVLTACEPTDADINKALKTEIDNVNNKMKQSLGDKAIGNTKLEVNLISTKKVKCKEESSKNGYLCDVEVEVEAPIVGKKKDTGPILFVNENGVWKATSN